MNFHISNPRVREDVQGCYGLQVHPSKKDCASIGPDECPDQLEGQSLPSKLGKGLSTTMFLIHLAILEDQKTHLEGII